MIKAFPKIFSIGTDYIADIFKHEVEITEKIDGSQFDFGKIDGNLYCRSKGAELYIDNPDKMFKEAVDYIALIQDKIPDNTTFYCEYLKNPRHNILEYKRTPLNHLILFGVSEKTGSKFMNNYNELLEWANKLEISVVPLIYKGKINKVDELLKFMDTESCLGGVKIEGIVCKNYENSFLLGGQPIPIMMGKYVSEAFKEVHREQWGSKFTSKGKWQTFKESFITEARWQKSIQHLLEKGDLENSPRDIGKLINEIKKDIEEEEKENIKNFLWKEFGDEILRSSTKGFPEWYKKKLLERAFENPPKK